MSTPERPLRVDVVVHGRFHAFELVRAMVARGHDVRLLTNYPKFVVKRFGVSPARVKTCLWHGLATRLYRWLSMLMPLPDMEPRLHRAFGRWAARLVRRDADAVHVFSGVAEEVFTAIPAGGPKRMLARGSAHIRAQHRWLQEEERRTGLSVEKPSSWIIAREEREYALADRIVVLSSFALNSFLDHGTAAGKLAMLGLAANVSCFEPAPHDTQERRRRILAGEPLRILMVGSFTPRKGAIDFIEVAKRLHGRMRFGFVGDLPPAGSPLRRLGHGLIDFVPRVSEFELPGHYAAADVFCFPTIEDGYAVVIAQALMARLPAITTTNCAGPDVVAEGRNGWVVPIREPERIVSRLAWCDTHREALASMIANMGSFMPQRGWADVAREFEELVRD